MGMLLDGTWLDTDATAREVAKDGKFQRSESQRVLPDSAI